MPFYYAYHVDDAGHVISRFDIHADEDSQAIEKAKARLVNREIEVWCVDRKVADLKRPECPSIIPNDRLDRDIYLVLEDFSSGAAWRETDEGETDVSAVVEDLLTGQYEQPLRVVAFNPVERWSRDATEEIAEELDRRISAERREVSEALQEFIESNIGRKMGVQLDLPLRLWGRHGQK